MKYSKLLITAAAALVCAAAAGNSADYALFEPESGRTVIGTDQIIHLI